MELRLLASCVLLLASSCAAMLPVLTHVHSRFEYKYSFKGPYLVNSQANVPFWTYGGSCIPSDDQVRVCPSIKSRRGWIWAKEAFSSKHWMVDITLRVTGRLKTGADGMAVWFTAQPGTEGLAFGNTELWQGLGIMLDSFDNNGLHDNPKIMAVTNDGTQRFDHSGDGVTQEVGSCMKDFRNKPNPVKFRIIYLRGALELWVHEGVSSAVEDYQLCLRTEAISNIPLEGYFGISAATGGLSDDHDVLSFLVHRLVPMEEQAQKLLQEVNKDEADKLTDKYSSLSNEFDQRKQDYLKEHEDTRMGMGGDWQYEIEMEQNVRYIADMQSQLSRDIAQLSQTVDSLVTGVSPDQRGVHGNALPDLAAIKNTEANILHQISELRAVVDRSGVPGAKVTTSEQLQPVYEVKNIVQQNSQRLASLEQHAKDAAGHQCPTVTSDPPSCLSPTLFLVVIVMEVLVIVGYMVYRQRQEVAAKKFF